MTGNYNAKELPINSKLKQSKTQNNGEVILMGLKAAAFSLKKSTTFF